MSNTPILVTLTGPSCSGKSTLEKLLKGRGFTSLISVTTRKPRAGEVDGVSYYFLDHDEFAALERAGELVEQVEFNGNRYGVTKSEMNRAYETGMQVVVVVDPHGAFQYRQYVERRPEWKILSLFVNAPPETIARRFLDRFRQDIEAGNCKSLESYPSRLAEMMTTEREWTEFQHSLSGQYDVWFDNFDGDATSPTVEFVVSHVDAIKTQQTGGLEDAA